MDVENPKCSIQYLNIKVVFTSCPYVFKRIYICLKVMNISIKQRAVFDTIMEYVKDNKMISIIISTFIHSVILANPVEQVTDSESFSDGKTESSQEDCDDETEGSAPLPRTVSQLYDEPIKDFSADMDDSKKMFESHQDNAHQSSHTLPSNNLTFDALSYNERSVPIHRNEKKEPKVHEKRDQKKDDVDMNEFIKQLILKQHGSVPALTFFDAAIVYDERDYSAAETFRRELMDMLRPRLGDDLRIELFDSEQFAQSKVMVVKDVIDRCSVVMLYLTPNFSTPEMDLFIEEGIAMTRLGLGNFPSDPQDSRRRWVLKPVHTESKSHRRYPIPIGLLSLKGINWFDKSEFTMNQMISIFNSAITERNQREAGAFPDFAHQKIFGGKLELPQQHSELPSILKVTTPPEEPHFEHMSYDDFSFPQNFRPPPPEIPSMSAHQLYDRPLYQQREGQHYQHDYFTNINMNQGSPFERTQRYPHAPTQTGSYHVPVQSHNFAQAPVDTTRPPYSGQTHQILQPGFLNNNTIAQNDTGHNLPHSYYMHAGALPHPIAPTPMGNYMSNPVYDCEPSVGLCHQHDYRRRQTHDPNTYLHSGEDFRPENIGTSRTNTSNDVPSAIPPYLSNLSTDDVEIDNYADAEDKSKPRKPDKRHPSNKSQRKAEKHVHDVVSESDSSDSDSSDDEYTVAESRRPKNKIINISGCSVVQLGKGNIITRPIRHEVPIERPSRGFKSRTPVSARKTASVHTDSNSISEDNLSYTSIGEHTGRQHAASAPLNTPHWNISNDNENMLVDDNNVNVTNNLTETSFSSKSTVRDAHQTQYKTSTKLNVAVNNDMESNEYLEHTANCSPDTNFNEDELFVSGPLARTNDSPVRVHERSRDAPFTFSRTRQTVHILKHVPKSYKSSEMVAETDEETDLD